MDGHGTEGCMKRTRQQASLAGAALRALGASGIAAEGSGTDPALHSELTADSPLAPLSVIKVYVAAEWLHHAIR